SIFRSDNESQREAPRPRPTRRWPLPRHQQSPRARPEMGAPTWARSFVETALVKNLLDTPEAQQIAGLGPVLQKHLGIDWPTLRDDILGDSVVLAFRPGTATQLEAGMIALRAAKPQRLADLIDRFNQMQKASGELKGVEPAKHLGMT